MSLTNSYIFYNWRSGNVKDFYQDDSRKWNDRGYWPLKRYPHGCRGPITQSLWAPPMTKEGLIRYLAVSSSPAGCGAWCRLLPPPPEGKIKQAINKYASMKFKNHLKITHFRRESGRKQMSAPGREREQTTAKSC